MLTEQESKVLRLLCQGYTNPEIAKELVISVHTVKAHVTHILRKLNVSNRTIAAYLAGKNSLIDE